MIIIAICSVVLSLSITLIAIRYNRNKFLQTKEIRESPMRNAALMISDYFEAAAEHGISSPECFSIECSCDRIPEAKELLQVLRLLNGLLSLSEDTDHEKVLDQYVKAVYNSGVGSPSVEKYRGAYHNDPAVMDMFHLVDLVYNISIIGAIHRAGS